MKLITLSVAGIGVPTPHPCRGRVAGYWAITHGQHGPRSWTVRFPFAAARFPVSGPPPSMAANYDLTPTGRFDQRGQARFTLVPSTAHPKKQLVFWSTGRPSSGTVVARISGAAAPISNGEEILPHGEVIACPVVLVSGPCRLWYHCSGSRLAPLDISFEAVFNGDAWRTESNQLTPAKAA